MSNFIELIKKLFISRKFWVFITMQDYKMDVEKFRFFENVAINEKSAVMSKFIRVATRSALLYLASAVLVGVSCSFLDFGVIAVTAMCVWVGLMLFLVNGIFCYSRDCPFDRKSYAAGKYKFLLCIFLLALVFIIPLGTVQALSFCGIVGDASVPFLEVILSDVGYLLMSVVGLMLFLIVVSVSILIDYRDAIILTFRPGFSQVEVFVVHYRDGAVEAIDIGDWDIQILDVSLIDRNDILLIKKPDADGRKLSIGSRLVIL